jgi:hypothetical protein
MITETPCPPERVNSNCHVGEIRVARAAVVTAVVGFVVLVLGSMPALAYLGPAWPISGQVTQITGPAPNGHPGIDIGAAVGTPVYATSDGVVVDPIYDPYGYGCNVQIAHASGSAWTTIYAHLSQIVVSTGTVVVQHTSLIGYSGGAQGAPCAGNSQGPHLHFGFLLNGSPQRSWEAGQIYVGQQVAANTAMPAFPGGFPPPGSKSGIYRSSVAQPYFRNSISGGAAESTFLAGAPGDVGLWCDWNSDGLASWGVYRPSNLNFYLSNQNFTGAQTFANFRYGDPGDIPLCGSWFGGIATPGIYRPSNATFYLRTNNDPNNEQTVAIQYGAAGDKPVVGHWAGSPTQTTTIGIFRPGSGAFYLRNSNTPGVADHTIVFGAGTDNPIVGDWDSNGTDTPGITRNGNGLQWYLTNATDGIASTDLQFAFGDISDQAMPWK